MHAPPKTVDQVLALHPWPKQCADGAPRMEWLWHFESPLSVKQGGQTVNLAAKLQSLAESWQVAMSEAVSRAPGVAAYFEKEGAKLEDMSFASKALREPLPVKRWTCFVEG
jgi:hypothetical protein